MSSFPLPRRQFLLASSWLATSPWLFGAERDSSAHVRATDGDDRAEPNWDERLTLTVGPKQADLVGNDDKVLQAAVDYMARVGGGTVRILPGTYLLRNSVYLPSKVRLQGSGPETILTKGPSESVAISADSDWYDQEITIEKASGFQAGDGITIIAKNPHNGATDVIKRTLVARSGNRFKLNDGLRKNVWVSSSPTCTSIFPLLTSEQTHDVVIEDLVLDGNRENNANLNGNYGGCIFIQDCNRYTFRRVEARNFNGDGFSFQICHDVVVDSCHSHDNADLGVHPGSGSQRPLIRGCRLERNNIGIFWCWGVKFGLAEENRISGNRSYGISIGHNDTDNVMRRNEVRDSGKVGVLFRDDARGQDFWANRNTLEENRIINSGGTDGIGIDIQGRTRDIQLIRNEIQEERLPMQRIGIRVGADASKITLVDNRIAGYENEIVDQRSTT